MLQAQQSVCVGSRIYDGMRADPDRVALVLVQADGTEQDVLARELLARAASISHVIGRAGAERQIVGICLYHSVDLYAAFLGVLWAGHIPTMMPPPSPRIEPRKYSTQFAHMVSYIKPSAAIVDQVTLNALATASEDADLGSVRIIDPLQIPALSDEFEPVPGSPDDIALIQHSSGTTGMQKGIALSNRAVFAHNDAYAARIQLASSDSIASWLPLYHDMGFIACFIMPFMVGIRVIAMSPFDWVRSPAMLLHAIHRHRATLCWLPNFAYAFLARAFRGDAGSLDLSSIRRFVNSSEPVYHQSHAAFLERFSASGVSEDQLTASYAMAENVYAVTQSEPGRQRTICIDAALFRDQHRALPIQDGGMRFVSNGSAVEGTSIRIQDEEANVLGTGEVGEIAIRGSYLFSGYYRRADLTAQAMTADGWYRTGDLGFLLDDELFVTGRKKDLIIVQGRNFYPTDIEAAAGEVDGVAAGRVVAFGIPDERSGTESLVILAEAAAESCDAEDLQLRIRAHIAQIFDCTPADVRIVAARWLIKSTSGKLARADNRAKYLTEI